MTFKEMDNGTVGLIMRSDNGDIVQIGLTEEQSNMLQVFLTAMSKENKLIQLPKQYNLQLVEN